MILVASVITYFVKKGDNMSEKVKDHKKKSSKIGSSNIERRVFWTKMAIVMVLIFFQIVFFFAIYGIMREYILYWKTVAFLLSGTVVFYLINKNDNPAYKLAWIVLVLAFPLIGGAMYVALAGNTTRAKFIKDALKNHLDTFKYMPNDSEIQKDIKEKSKSASVQSTYISKYAGYSAYVNSDVTYFSSGEKNYETLISELKLAKHYIFMEYFIIKHGEMWSGVLEILAQKASEGVDVRLIYDDFGCAMWVPSRFIEEMTSYGIKVVPFNKVMPIINLRQNNRDHRKITIIDGHTGFTGGINLADEYINRVDRFGYWKDTGIMVKGDAVWNLTLMFLQTWHMLTGADDDYELYKPQVYSKYNYGNEAYVQPYGDTPVDDEFVGENVYLNMINKAKYSVYITTPYLIIDNEMLTALTLAAKSGIDVRIITPGIPDKKMVFMVTQSYYDLLVKAGVKIYEFTPGFIHAKSVVIDDAVATVGTINFDYRSLYLHFECGVWMYNCQCISQIKQDFLETLQECHEITADKIKDTSGIKRFLQGILRLFAPLL